MLSGRTLEQVLKRCELRDAPNGSGKQYLTTRETVRFLNRVGLHLGVWPNWGAENPYCFRDDEDFSVAMTCEGLEKWPALLCVDSRTLPGFEHAVVWCPERRLVLDPQHDEAQPISRYRVRAWIPVVPFADDD